MGQNKKNENMDRTFLFLLLDFLRNHFFYHSDCHWKMMEILLDDEVMRMGRKKMRMGRKKMRMGRKKMRMKKDENETRLETRKKKIHSFEIFFVLKNSIEGKNSKE